MVNGDLPVVDGVVPLPDWSFFDEEMLVGFDEAAKAEFRERSIPVPERVARDAQRLSDERRYEVPITVVACEYPSEMIREWIGQGHPGTKELAAIRRVDYIDLPTGHWPQLTRPDELARAILGSVGGS